ncbi:MAG: DNA-3-methyladenine glycosylase 2 family protein [Clostridia bacterium]|nr:DNA-3-methyladenine glycosylase 2 family protein [Clostridia bacterium]
MKVCIKNNDIVLENVTDFKPTDTFDCGQCFRFNPDNNGGYIGTAYGRTVRITQDGDTVTLHSTTQSDFDSVWKKFLDLDRDYTAIKKELTKGSDAVMASAIDYGKGIRILKQDLWETVISFIISASNNIPRIKKIIELLCTNFGTPHEYEGKTYYSFPDAKTIAALNPAELDVIRAGFRTKYIYACAKSVASGEFELDLLYNMSTTDAKRELMKLNGIGNKVADCILLFALNKFDSFPIDVWIKRIMEYCYFENEPQPIPVIAEFANSKFGNLGGIAQQYLFYYARSLKIGT